MSSKCVNCKAFAAVDEKTGQCRLDPPIFSIMSDNTRKWLWPGVAVDHWCLKYEGKEEVGRPTEVSVDGQVETQPEETPKSGS